MNNRFDREVKAAAFCLLITFCAVARPGELRTNVLEVRNGTVVVDGMRVGRTTTLSQYEAILGKPDRISRLKYTIYTYDGLGIRLYRPPGQEIVVSIGLDFVKESYDFSPTNSFQGVVSIEGERMSSRFPQSGISRLSGVQLYPKDKNMEFPVTGASDGEVDLTFQYLSSRKRLEVLAISWRKDEPAETASTPLIGIVTNVSQEQKSLEERLADLQQSMNGGAKQPTKEELEKEAGHDLAEIRSLGLVDRALRDFTSRHPNAAIDNCRISYFMDTNTVYCSISYRIASKGESQDDSFCYKRQSGTNWILMKR